MITQGPLAQSCHPQVTRTVYNEQSGKSEAASQVIEVPIKAGWKAGTKITYAGGEIRLRHAQYTAMQCIEATDALQAQQHG